MGREVRRVPADWEHPKNSDGCYIALHGRSFSKSLKEWEEGEEMWNKGLRENFSGKGRS